MFCKYCGSAQDADAIFCSACGKQIQASDASEYNAGFEAVATVGKNPAGASPPETSGNVASPPNALQVVQVLKQLLEEMPGSRQTRFSAVPVRDGAKKAGLGVNPSFGLDTEFPLRFYLDAEAELWIRDCEALRYFGDNEGLKPWETWPADLTGYMVPFVIETLCRFQEAKIWDRLQANSLQPRNENQDELERRFQSWAVNCSNLLLISKGEFEPEWVRVAEDTLPRLASGYWEWHEDGLSFVSPETQQLFQSMGKQFKSRGFPPGFQLFPPL